MKVRSPGGYQIEAAGEFAVPGRIGGRMLAVEDLYALKPDVNEVFEKAGKFQGRAAGSRTG